MSAAPITPDLVRKLREAYASGAPRAAGDDCEDPERIWEAVRGTLEPSHVARLLRHSAACTACDRAFQLARELQRQVREEAGPATVPLRSARRWMPRPALVGGMLAAAAAVIVVVVLRRPEPPAERVLREAPAPRIAPLPGNERLARDRFILRWSSGPEGTVYDLWVTTPELREVYRAGKLDRPEARVPTSALEGLPGGTDVLWRVEARFPDGGHAESPAFRTRIE